jgi:predicted  nucleic acid-binding Zn-ribbon protein
MRHQCVRCGRIYRSDSKKLIEGCACGSTLFLYLRKPDLKVKKSQLPGDLDKLEKQIRELLGAATNPDQPISISIENLRLGRNGVYNMDLESLLKGDPIILRDSEGVYFLDLKNMLREQEAEMA